MAFRFWRRTKLAPGISLNLSKGGPSVSFGPRGAKLTVGARGGRASAGIPGTGLFYSKRLGAASGRKGSSAGARQSAAGSRGVPPARQDQQLTLSFFQKLFMPKAEENFVYGCREYVLGNSEKALELLSGEAQIVDASFLAGVIAIGEDRPEEGLGYLLRAEKESSALGSFFGKYGIAPEIYMHISDEIGLFLGPTERDLLLLLVEVLQGLGRLEEARERSELLLKLVPQDAAVKLSHAELLYSINPRAVRSCKAILSLAEGVKNDSPIHTALLFYKAKALRELGLLSAAKDVLTDLTRRKKDRPQELMCALFYERALVYEGLGQKGRARKDLEKVFSIEPRYEDVEKRLGMKP